MKNDKQPSHQDLKALYSAAIEFKNAAPWDWMHDSDLFGVKDPVSGETGYCQVNFIRAMKMPFLFRNV
jgi:hypothetical protein